MISQQEFDELVATYEKYGWVLRRVVARDLTAAPRVLPTGVAAVAGVVDAAWFSRPPSEGAIAWEIRFLGGTQFALVVHLDENSIEFEDELHQTEERLAASVVAPRKA
ncbi:MAG: hypothetical protein ACJ73D_04370 [Pyrinomonadaceae bacterium]